VCYFFFGILRLESNSINILLQLNNYTFCFQIAGGSGITPMLQVVRAILKNPDDNTQVSCDKKFCKLLDVHFFLDFFDDSEFWCESIVVLSCLTLSPIPHNSIGIMLEQIDASTFLVLFTNIVIILLSF
jgi:hypothetical protein